MATKQNSAQQRLEEQLRKQEAHERWKEECQARYKELIEKDNVYFLVDRNKYVQHDAEASWIFVESAALKVKYMLTSQEETTWFNEVVHMLGRVKDTAVNTFRPVSSNKLNTMTMDGWLQPAKGTVDPVFDILFDSLSGGRKEVKDHLEAVFTYKYIHPEEYKLPCITISGEGGAGKNETIELLFATVFGSQQVASIGTDEAFGTYNGQMLGKTVVYIDESIPDKTNAEKLKQRVGNKTIQVNVKYGLQGTFDNTPWWWLGGNGTNGTMMLAGDTTDRRYSVITIDRNLMYWIGRHIGHDVDGRGASLPAKHPCVVWWGENSWKLSDPEFVAAWLYNMVAKWGDQKFPPAAYHDEDYTTIIDKQKSSFDLTMEYVFDDEAFTHIETTTLYKVYELMTRRDNAKGGLLKSSNFHADAERWLEVKNTGVRVNKENVLKADGKTTTAKVYAMKGGKVKRNDDYYFKYDAERRIDVLVERDVKEVKDSLAGVQF